MTTAIILAGGRGRRLGRDKASVEIAGKTLLQHVIDRVAPLADAVVVVGRAGQALPAAQGPDLRFVEDELPDAGPLAGLAAGLKAAPGAPALALACDMPLLQASLLAELLRRLDGHDAVVALRDGLPEPLGAVYAPRCLAAIEACLARGELKATAFLTDVDAVFVPEQEWRRFDPEGLSFFNLNTPEDLASASALIADASAREV